MDLTHTEQWKGAGSQEVKIVRYHKSACGREMTVSTTLLILLSIALSSLIIAVVLYAIAFCAHTSITRIDGLIGRPGRRGTSTHRSLK